MNSFHPAPVLRDALQTALEIVCLAAFLAAIALLAKAAGA